MRANSIAAKQPITMPNMILKYDKSKVSQVVIKLL